MKTLALIALLTIFSIPAFAQGYLAVGPTLATRSQGIGGRQTQAGVFADGQLPCKKCVFGLLDFNVGGSVEFNNTPRFIDNGNGGNLEFEPRARLYLPFSEGVSLYVEGGVNGQRFAFGGPDYTVVNPQAGFGIRKQAEMENGQLAYSIQLGGVYHFDDVNNSIGAPQFWRGYGFRLQGLRTRNGIGYFVGLDFNRQSATTFVLQPGTQIKLRGGIAFGGGK